MNIWEIVTSAGTAVGGLGAALGAWFSFNSIRESKKSAVFISLNSNEFEFRWLTTPQDVRFPTLSEAAAWKFVNLGGGSAANARVNIGLTMQELPKEFSFLQEGDPGAGIQSCTTHAGELQTWASFCSSDPLDALLFRNIDVCPPSFGFPGSEATAPFSGWAIKAALHYFFSEVHHYIIPTANIPGGHPLGYESRRDPSFSAQVEWVDIQTGRKKVGERRFYKLVFVKGSRCFLRDGVILPTEPRDAPPPNYNEVRFRCRIEGVEGTS